MSRINTGKLIIVLGHAFVIWVLCGIIMGIGLAVASEKNALIAHAFGAPLISAAVSLFYFRKFNYTSPLKTAVIFLSFMLFMDFFVVSIVILRNFEIFYSILGTWLTLTLIFLSTYLTGLYVVKNS